MLAIVKIQEGYCVVDLDEDTELFDSIEEAQEIAGSIISEARSSYNKEKNWLKKAKKIEKTKGKFAASAYGYGKYAKMDPRGMEASVKQGKRYKNLHKKFVNKED